MPQVCGIAGIVGPLTPDAAAAVREMVALLAHRGPDDQGFHVDPEVALGMSRLAIIDPAHGEQPKYADGGDLQVVFNGEIYNHRELRRELESSGSTFQTTSDTEVVVEAYARWGDDAFRRFEGMFGVALWRSSTRTLTLARDRIGEKPLYVVERSGGIAFASELGALTPLGVFDEIDPRAVAAYFHLGYVPAPLSIWRSVSKLEPATILRWSAGESRRSRYWELPTGIGQPLDEASAVAELDRRLRDSVRDRLVADVDVGVLLSGGVDSSLVAWAAAEQHPSIRSFTISFDDPALDESAYAGQVAATLRTTHLVRSVTAHDCLDVVHKVAEIYDEPFADSSAIPTFLVCKAASEHVKVVLGGDGGDELFSGYGHYRAFKQLRRFRHAAMPPVRRIGERLARSRTDDLSRLGNVLDKLDRNPGHLYRNVVAVVAPGLLAEVLTGPVDLDGVTACFESHFAGELDQSARRADLHHYLPEDVLTKVDRASMATGLEVRAPFLDSGLVEWAFGLGAGVGPPGAKQAPRALLARRFPGALAHRPKQGFGVPLDRWLLGPLQPLLRDRLSPGSLASHGFVRPAAVQLLLERLEGGRRGAATALWAILQFQLWYDRWVT